MRITSMTISTMSIGIGETMPPAKPLTVDEQHIILTLRRDKHLSVKQIAFRVGRGEATVRAELERVEAEAISKDEHHT